MTRGVAKGGSGRVQAQAVPYQLKLKNRYTLIEQSSTLLKQSMALIVPYQLEIPATPLNMTFKIRITTFNRDTYQYSSCV